MAKAKKKKSAKAKPSVRGIQLGNTAISTLSPTDVRPVPLEAPGFCVTVNGLIVDGDPDIVAAQQAGDVLRTTEKAGPFALGDFINYVETRFGEMASQIIDFESGWSEKTCKIYSWLAGRISPGIRRMDRLGIKHHLLVATLSPAKQEHWLNKASADDAEEPWTAAQLKKALEEGEPDLPETFWVLVSATSMADQSALQAQFEALGRSCKAVVRRERKKKES